MTTFSFSLTGCAPSPSQSPRPNPCPRPFPYSWLSFTSNLNAPVVLLFSWCTWQDCMSQCFILLLIKGTTFWCIFRLTVGYTTTYLLMAASLSKKNKHPWYYISLELSNMHTRQSLSSGDFRYWKFIVHSIWWYKVASCVTRISFTHSASDVGKPAEHHRIFHREVLISPIVGQLSSWKLSELSDSQQCHPPFNIKF